MNRLNALFRTMISTAVAVMAMTTTGSSAEKPNVLFIMSDDHTTQAFGVYGSRLATLNPTPVIDSLAKNGMRFDRVYCNNSICTPSRASIITGQYSQTNGVLDLNGTIGPRKQYLAKEMKKLGYQTAVVGKWHLKGEPAAFDYYCVLPGQGAYFNPVFKTRNAKGKKVTIKKDGQHSSDAITDISLEWLRNGRDKGKPFFLMHHFKAPHDMFQNAKRYDRYLEDVEIPEPDNLHDQPAEGFGSVASRKYGTSVTKGRLGAKLGAGTRLPQPEKGKYAYQRYLKRYLRCVKGVDDNVKRLIDYLKETGEFKNTVIIYTGDQGFFLGEHDFYDKRWMYEESFRMPFIVHWPKRVKAGTVNDWLINNTDFAPTILEIAGLAKTPDYMQGRSFAGALRSEAKPADWRTVTYYRYWMHMTKTLRVPAHFGIRNRRFKLIFFYGANLNGSKRTPAAWEFYDTEKDPSEMKNEYSNPEYKKVISDMKAQLKETREKLNETDAKYPEVQKIIDEHWDQ